MNSNEEYQINLLRLLAGQLHSLLLLTAAHDQYGKGFAHLTEDEQKDVEASTSAYAVYFLRLLTPQRIVQLLEEPTPPKIH